MSGSDIVVAIIEILVSGLTEMANGIGTGVQDFVNSLFFVTTEGTTELSVFAIVVISFGAIGLSVGIGRLLLGWLGSLGGRGV